MQCGSTLFWVISFSCIPWALIFTYVFRNMLLQSTEVKDRVGYPYLPEDIRWDERTTVRYPAICTWSGVFAGLFGVGGGIVKGPLMLEMGVQPAVASATAATMITYTSASACVSFATFGLVDWGYAKFLFVLGFCCTFVGQLGINALMGDRQAPIVFSIGTVISLSAFLVAYEAVYENYGIPLDQLLKVSSVCSTQ
jgi:uncharacterized membrane protein YfcA